MPHKIKIGLLGLVAGMVTIATSFIPFAVLVLPGFIFGLLIFRQYKFFKHNWAIVLISGISYFVAMWLVVYSGLGNDYAKEPMLTSRQLWVLGGAVGGSMLGIGLRLLQIINTKHIFALSLLSAVIMFFIPADYTEWVGNVPNIYILFPVWQGIVAFYLAFTSNEERLLNAV